MGGGGRGGFVEHSLTGSVGQQQVIGQPMASKSASSSRDVFDGPPGQQTQYGTGMRPGGGGMGMGPSGGGGGGGGGGISGQQQSGHSPPKRRPPMSLAASDVREYYVYIVHDER